MRYSIFAGLPLGLVALTAGYELALRFASYEAAIVAAIATCLLTLVVLNLWDERRFLHLLNPPVKEYPVYCEAAREYLLLTFAQVQFEDVDGFRASWKISQPPGEQIALNGRIVIKTRVLDLNIVAWMIDSIDRGYKPRSISMNIKLSPTERGSKVETSYMMEPMLDWSRCAELIKQSNGWIDESLSRVALERMID